MADKKVVIDLPKIEVSKPILTTYPPKDKE